jgi:two-component system nitrate/nitrite response regulator NarL
MKAPRILIADDHEFIRRGLISILLARHPDWEIVGEASNGLDAIRLAESTRPDIAILDLSMPERNGLQVTERLHESAPSIKTLILTMHTGEQIVRNLMKAGASAYMVKSDASSKLVEAVERLASGHTLFASPMAVDETAEPAPAQYILSPREAEVLRLLASGKGNKQIATELKLSVRTVESHRANILTRLGAESLGELVRIAVRDGLI